MAFDPVFNDKSVEASSATPVVARRRMSRFIRVLRDAPRHGLGSALRIPESFHVVELAPNYAVHNWVDDRVTPQEERAFILTLATMAPFLAHASAPAADTALESEVCVGSDQAECFLAAVVLDVPLISFYVGLWVNPIVRGTWSRLTLSGAVTKSRINLRNLSDLIHYETHEAWITCRRADNISNMAQLWADRSALFPNLVFCPTVESQLLRIASSDPHFHRVVVRLFALEKYFKTWSSGPFNPKAFAKCNPSSPQTLEHREYGPRYRFTKPSGDEVICSWHLYLTPGAWRIYFSPDPTIRSGVIGHIGVKLPSVTYGLVG